jgi:uncharacterized membrane protein
MGCFIIITPIKIQIIKLKPIIPYVTVQKTNGMMISFIIGHVMNLVAAKKILAVSTTVSVKTETPNLRSINKHV